MLRLFAFYLFVLALVPPQLSKAAEPVPLPPTPERPGAESGSTVIYYRIWIADVYKIDSVAQTFTANVAMILRWQDPRLKHDSTGTKQFAIGDIWNPRPFVVNESSDVRKSLPEIADVAPDGTVVYRQRFVGQFVQPMDLRDFPFDAAAFKVQMVAAGYRAGDIKFEPDPQQLKAGFPKGIGIAPKLTAQDWQITDPTAQSEPYLIAPGQELAGLSFGFTGDRNSNYFIIKVIIPLLLIVIMSWSIFWIDPSESGPQFSIAVTTMLTLIAYRFAIESNTPKLPYLTRVDAFILMSSVLVLLSLFEVLATSKLVKRNQLEKARSIDRHCRWAFPLVFTVCTIWAFF